MSFRYIGSKARLAEKIMEVVGTPSLDGVFIDAFCGTGAVAEAAADLGWDVRINDHLHSAVITSAARLMGEAQARFSRLGGYSMAIDSLNRLQPVEGFIWRTYSPASEAYCGIERRYFTCDNAAKVDAVRRQIELWRENGDIDENEAMLLIADLFAALNRVANIAGTFGCFLSKWTAQSQSKLRLQCRQLRARNVRIEATVGDVFGVSSTSNDVVYLDPPYTKRQYASYYHILETVALNDEPTVEGVSGLRPWKDKASDFCYKARALPTLSELMKSLKARQIYLSYSSEGHIAIGDMEKALSAVGRFSMNPLGSIGRYRPNKVASQQGSDVTEYLVVIEKETTSNPSIADIETSRRTANGRTSTA